jgi:excisionase family DNA binding protein
METSLSSQTPTVHPLLLRAGDVAKLLNISASLAYKLMQTGAIPTVRINRSVRVKPKDLDEYINRSWSGWQHQIGDKFSKVQ